MELELKLTEKTVADGCMRDVKEAILFKVLEERKGYGPRSLLEIYDRAAGYPNVENAILQEMGELDDSDPLHIWAISYRMAAKYSGTRGARMKDAILGRISKREQTAEEWIELHKDAYKYDDTPRLQEVCREKIIDTEQGIKYWMKVFNKSIGIPDINDAVFEKIKEEENQGYDYWLYVCCNNKSFKLRRLALRKMVKTAGQYDEYLCACREAIESGDAGLIEESFGSLLESVIEDPGLSDERLWKVLDEVVPMILMEWE